jgi:hypothetical protein
MRMFRILVAALSLLAVAAPLESRAATPGATSYDELKLLVGSKGIDFVADTIVAVPLSASYTPSYTVASGHTTLSQVTSYEVTTCGGARITLTGKTWTEGTSPNRYMFKWTTPAPITWTATGCTLTIKYVAFVQSTGTDSTSKLLWLVDLDTTSGSSTLSATTGAPNGTITLTMDATYGGMYL